MKNAVAIFLLSVLPAAAQLATNVTVTNLQGNVFQNVTIDHTNSLGVVWVASDGGMGEFRYGDFPMEFWTSLGLSNCAEQYYEAVKLEQDQERRERQSWEQERKQERKEERAQAAALEKINKEVQEQLSASNSEEQSVDAMPASPTNMTSDEISARDGILKALLNISSATDVGVTRNNYEDLLAKAVAALAFGKTKLLPERHEKFLTCAEKAISFYTEANDDWANYFKYDWQQEQDKTLMSVYDLHELRENGVTFDVSNFQTADDLGRPTSASTVMYYVPFKESLTLYWEAADIYVHKMQHDSQR